MSSLLPRAALQLTLALALALTAVPLEHMFRAAADPAGPAAGMSAPALVIVDNAVRVAAPADSGSAYRLDLSSVTADVRLSAAPRALTVRDRVDMPLPPSTRMIALGRMQDDGG